MASFNVQIMEQSGQVATNIVIQSGQTLFIAGPNGVGKSALIDHISAAAGLSNAIETFSGHRQITFQNDDVENVGQKLSEFEMQLRQHRANANRYRGSWGEQHLRSVIKRILNSQNQTNDDIVGKLESGVDKEIVFNQHKRILTTISEIFDAARIPISFRLASGSLQAFRNGDYYSVDRLSDGERASLLLAGAVLTRPNDTFIAIDEPEKHLNPAISGPFISTLFRARPDLGYVISSHDLSLIDWLEPDEVLHVRNSKVIVPEQDFRSYDISRLGSSAGLDNDLRKAVLGSRKALLLVEGDASSDDKALYALIYKGWTIEAKGDWESVQNGVRAICSNESYVWLNVAGIIDGDGRGIDEKQRLAADKIFALRCATIENVFCLKTICVAMAKAHKQFYGGAEVEERIELAQSQVSDLLKKNKNDIISRQLVWFSTRELSSRKMSVEDARSGKTIIEGIDLSAERDELSSNFDKLIDENEPLEAASLLPIKNTNIPGRIASALGFPNFKAYKQAILANLQSDTTCGAEIRSCLVEYLPALPERE